VEETVYKRIVVHVDNAEAARRRVASAVAVAQRFEAALHGCCVVPNLDLAMYGGAPVPGDIIDQQIRALEQDLESAERVFREVAEGAGIAVECTGERARAAAAMTAALRYADLAVVGKPDPDDDRCTAAGVAVALAFGTPVPVLALPPGRSFEESGSRIVIAWNATREAQAAARNALPFLIAARAVDIVSVVDDEGLVNGEENAAERLMRYLAAHGVTARPHNLSAEGKGEGEVVLSQCQELDADLLVLGAYGHSRFRELLLGGVTLNVMEAHEIPILICH